MTPSNTGAFALAWERLLANFAELPEQMQSELRPYEAKVAQAQKEGSALDPLARDINAIAVRHVRARLLPLE